MKKKLSMKLLLVLVAISFGLAAFKTFKKGEKSNYSETCSSWSGTGIQFRQCATDWGLRSSQFYNGYAFQIHFYFYLEFTDGTNSGNNGNIYVDGNSYTDKFSNDNSSGTNKTVQTWRITKKERKLNNGQWETF
ncbi:MAG: hypothetical protein ACHQF4_09815 [Sphingobacteriales bacterium]